LADRSHASLDRDQRGADPEGLRQAFSVVLERTVRELNGTACLDLGGLPPILRAGHRNDNIRRPSMDAHPAHAFKPPMRRFPFRWGESTTIRAYGLPTGGYADGQKNAA